MPIDVTTDLAVGEQTITGVRWSWGTFAAYPREREEADGWGTQIETAAVIEMFDLIADGRADARDVRRLLAQMSATICEEHERPIDEDY
ncbi:MULTISPECIES: hypothetical protein [unclassified Streptomyces]|uniref:hypothetical protein n=1 Tax=unclassified Streptomyces TaxID=2593676 RepID=UPI00093CF372|nr:hypothetical protein [Streptomyces sp. CB02261]OKJ52559.1 hypothetical protein AMK29_30515 [Streptomyces sp. CB02261]